MIRRGAAALAAASILAGSLQAASLADRIERLLDSSAVVRSAFWGIRVVELDGGRTLYETNPERFFVPASNTKLFTTALALTRLGPDFRFQTRVLADSAPDAAGCVRGPLILAGGGDPNLSGRAIPYRMGLSASAPLGPVEDLANQVAARGVRRVLGGIVGDDSWYVRQPYPEGWAIDDPLYEFGAPVSALSINDNTVELAVRPGTRPGDPASISLDPPVEYYAIDNRVRTAPAGTPRRIRLERDPGSRQVRLWGDISPRDRGESFPLGIEDPAEYAALAFRQALEARGIVVEGGVSTRHLFPSGVPDSRDVPEPGDSGAVELARRVSAPLIEDLRITDKVSQNLHAELALRAVGRARRGAGSLEAGLAEMEDFLAEAGIEAGSYSFNDGSGLARLNLVSPAAVVRLLTFMFRSPSRESWISLLPVAGQDGTLSSRFGDGPGAGRIFAKTGTVTHVSALSGYARRPDGAWLAFSILVNNYNGRAAEVRGVMDRICTLMVE